MTDLLICPKLNPDTNVVTTELPDKDESRKIVAAEGKLKSMKSLRSAVLADCASVDAKLGSIRH